MRHLLIVVAAFILLIAVAPVSAEPSILGPTGLFVNPTADVTPVDHIWVALNYYDNGGSAIWNANVVGSIAENLEAGAGAIHPLDGDNGYSFFIKWLFIPEQENAPGGAAGITVSDVATQNTVNFYVVGSKFFSFNDSADDNAAIHAGLNYTTGDGDNGFHFFGGADIEILKNLLAIAEYNGDKSSIFEGLTYGVRYYFTPQWTGQAAFIDGNLHLGGAYEF
jgi:hypothetical protein